MTRSEIVGKNICILRTARGMNQTDLANAIGRTQSMVALYETGKRLPSTQIMWKIAEVFGVPFDEIYYSRGRRFESSHPDHKSPENTAFSGLSHFWKTAKNGIKWHSTNNTTNNKKRGH